MEVATPMAAGPGASRQPPAALIDTQHNDMIFDIQLDYYGKRLATCSGDRSFRVYDVSPATSGSPATAAPGAPATAEAEPRYTLQHAVQVVEDSVAPLQRVAWAHPKFGSLVALAAQDGKVYIYREELAQAPPPGAPPAGPGAATVWRLKHVHNFHAQAVLGVAWAPYEYGLCLASASADGQVSFLTRQREGWVTSASFLNSDDGAACTSVSWAPYNALGSQSAAGHAVQRVVTGSTNHLVSIWQRELSADAALKAEWTRDDGAVLAGHADWVRDVAWAPNVGIPANVIASCSDDHTVRAWSQDEAGGAWKMHVVHTFRAPVYRISWSLTGAVLSAAAGDDEVTFWKQHASGEWRQLASVTDAGARPIE